MEILCQNSTASTDDFVYATTLFFDVDMQFNANVTNYVNLNFELYNVDLQYTGYDQERSVISVNSKFVINQELKVALGVIEGVIAVIFDRGHSIENFLIDTPFCWLNLDYILLLPNYKDSYMWGGVSPTYDPSRCPDGMPFGPWAVDMLLHPKTIIQQIIKNILDTFNKD